MKRVLTALLVVSVVSGALAFKTKAFGGVCAFQFNSPANSCDLLPGSYVIDNQGTSFTGATVDIPTSGKCSDATVPSVSNCQNPIKITQE